MKQSELDDFCRAVLADNRPRSGGRWDIIANAINLGRARAYRAGFHDGLRAASCDTHPKDGNSTEIEVPLVSGAVAATSGETPNA